MTDTVTCCMDLVGHPDFIAFCWWWQKEGRIPLPLPDWLREQGLEKQASVGDWALTAPALQQFGSATALIGPTPHKWRDSGWAWIVGAWGKRDHADELICPSLKVKQLFDERCSDSFETAVALFLDLYKVEWAE